MAFSINTNISAMNANLHSNLKNQAMLTTLDRLSSGSNMSNAAYDASGLSIANQLSAQVSGYGQEIMNANNSIGMLQVADGAMNGIQENMERVRVLTLQASNGTMNSQNRAIIQKEIDGLLKSSDNIASTTSYNGINLLNGGASSNLENINISDSSVSSLVGGIDVQSSAGLASALDTIDKGLSSIGDIRSELGSSQNKLMANIRSISVTQINVASAESQIRDVDFALESANFSTQSISSRVGSFTQTQANTSGINVTRLLG